MINQICMVSIRVIMCLVRENKYKNQASRSDCPGDSIPNKMSPVAGVPRLPDDQAQVLNQIHGEGDGRGNHSEHEVPALEGVRIAVVPLVQQACDQHICVDYRGDQAPAGGIRKAFLEFSYEPACQQVLFQEKSREVARLPCEVPVGVVRAVWSWDYITNYTDGKAEEKQKCYGDPHPDHPELT